MSLENSNDPFFALTEEGTKWNACIGKQAHPESYMDGYMEAALELVNAVIEQKQYIKRDTLAMPILYNARHALELSLKYIYDAFLKEKLIKTTLNKNHDIRSYWALLLSTKVGDLELTQHIKSLERFVVSLGNIDDDGQELRYATTRDGQKSLKDKALCNLVVIRKSLLELQKIIYDSKYRLEGFVDERQTKTYTKDLSRNDLGTISKMLPPIDRWTDDAFVKTKEEIKEAYGIGSNKFSDAINLIKNHRTMAARLGKEFDLLYLTDHKLKLVVQEWKGLHPPPDLNDLGTDFTNADFEAMIGHAKKVEEVQKNILRFLSGDEIADLETVFYIGREAGFCEFYERQLTLVRNKHKLNTNPAQEVRHLIEKVNFLEEIAKGLTILGKPTLAKNLLL
ncbi:conserved protein of unknown function [Nitrospira japonica]|uniref:HEPN domain-containing protein n=1 Tax=Nitrospira japonica TaxID=1325564 RepID=A0A1W1I348_9BACT|nr:hypothetical protein [Nitrospira japonica]SLM47414.1 conserved protein of unknown function [Nitrospira japonica]